MARAVAPVLVVVLAFASPVRAQFVAGDLYVSGWLDHIYRVEPGSWKVTTFADSADLLNGVSALAFSPSDTLLCSNYYPVEVREFDAAGSGSLLYDLSTGIRGPFGANGLVYDAAGDLYVSDFAAQEIRVYPAGGGAPSVFADVSDGLAHPDGLAFAANGDLYVTNRTVYQILKFDPQGNVAHFDYLPNDPNSIVVRGNGDIYVGTSPGGGIYRYPGGDASQRTLFTSFPNNVGIVTLQFDADQATLYFSSVSTGNLIAIDPDTASSNEVIAAGGIPGAVAIAVFRSKVPASWTNYDAGYPGTNGVPSFTAQQDPLLGTTITLDLANSYAQPTTGLLIVGWQRTSIPSSFGGVLLVVPAIVLPISFSYGHDYFSGDIPDDGGLAGVTLDLQALEADPGATKGVSFTAGLELVLGY